MQRRTQDPKRKTEMKGQELFSSNHMWSVIPATKVVPNFGWEDEGRGGGQGMTLLIEHRNRDDSSSQKRRIFLFM